MPIKKDSQFNAAHASVLFNNIGSSDSIVISDTHGNYIQIYSTLDADVIVSVTDMVGQKKQITVFGNVPIPMIIPCVFDGAVYIRHAGVAPTSGNIRIQSIYSGVSEWKKNYI